MKQENKNRISEIRGWLGIIGISILLWNGFFGVSQKAAKHYVTSVANPQIEPEVSQEVELFKERIEALEIRNERADAQFIIKQQGKVRNQVENGINDVKKLDLQEALRICEAASFSRSILISFDVPQACRYLKENAE